MITTFALAFALVTQQAPAVPTRTLPPTRAVTKASPITSPSDGPAKPAGMSQRRWEELRATAAKKKALKSARTRSGRLREAQWAKEEAEAIAKAEKDYKAALPYLLEAQRQQLDRLSAMERNQALQKMAAANDKIATAIQWQAWRGR